MERKAVPAICKQLKSGLWNQLNGSGLLNLLQIRNKCTFLSRGSEKISREENKAYSSPELAYNY